MSLFKKILSLLLALCLTATLLIPVTAASITPGKAQTVTVVDDETPVILSFVPAASGHYVFYSYNSQGYDPYGYIMDANKELLIDGDDTEAGMDFSISCYMTAGKTYYLAATCYAGSAKYTVQIDALPSLTAIAFERDTYEGRICGVAYPKINFYPENGARETVTMVSSNEQVVRIGDEGDFYFGIPGTAIVTATSQSGLTATCTVTVETPQALDPDTRWTFDASKGVQYLRFVAPSDGWYGICSEGDEIDPRVEVLDASLEELAQDDHSLRQGNFFAPFYLNAGQLCYLGFYVSDDSTGTAQITLRKLSSATAIQFPDDHITAYPDTLCWLTPLFVPRISIPEELTWHSSNEDVVYVDQTGHTSFLQPGRAVITVTSETGKTGSVDITVLNAPNDTTLTAWGICGPNLQWTLNKKGTLTITGQGDMYELYNNNSHWDRYSDQIKQVVFPKQITSIGYGAFLSCTQLTQITLPESIQSIDSGAFGHCYSLSKVTLPQKLDYFGYEIFDYCVSLEQINLPEGLKRLPNATFRGCVSLKSITLPGSLISIGDEAFSGCSLETVNLPRSLKTLGYGAFAGNPLTRITLPEGLTELRNYAFVNCCLEELTIPASVTGLGSGFVTGNDLHTLRFLGNAPIFAQDAFDYLTTTVYYPAGNRTWTQAIRRDYGGSVTWIPEGDPGSTLSGNAPRNATLVLSQDAAPVETVTVQDGIYRIGQLQPGRYTLTVSAQNYVTRAYEITVTDKDVTQEVTLHLIGDVDGNGKVNIGDVAKINAHVKGTSILTDAYLLQCANVNGGKLNIGDTASLYAHIRGTKKLY